jgi:hypothetical protein
MVNVPKVFGKENRVWLNSVRKTTVKGQQDLLGQVSRLRKREGQKYVNFYGKS